MFTSIKRLAAIALAALGMASAAQAQSTWTISRPGSYRLTANHQVTSGDASNVTLDLAGFSVSTAARGAGRGLVIDGQRGVTVRNGRFSGFNMNVAVLNSEATTVSNCQIIGDNLAPVSGPAEIGVLLLNSRASMIAENTISSVNLGIFVRGARSTGNRITKNVVTGGAVAARNLLGICYNPAPGQGPAGPRGDSIYNNHITRYNFAAALSAESVFNVFTDNVMGGFTGPFREPNAFTAQGGTNVEADNSSVIIPATDL
jgi:parallel beta-helix repeat protein